MNSFDLVYKCGKVVVRVAAAGGPAYVLAAGAVVVVATATIMIVEAHNKVRAAV